MSDLDEIRDLLGRYCELVDGADWDGVGELFTFGVLTDERGTELARGIADVAAFYRDSVQLHDGRPGTKHLVTNVVIESQGAERIVSRSSYLVLQALDDFPLQPIISGRYRDTFVRTGSGWAFAERSFTADLFGDLSRHLTYEVRRS